MDQVKFVALDRDDLEVVSTHLQDALVKVADVIWRPQDKRLVVGLSAVFPEALADFLGAHRGLAKGALGEDESEFFATVTACYVFGAHAAQKSLANSG